MNNLEFKEIRHKLGLTQKELAERLGVSVNTIQNYEKGGVIPASKDKILGSLLEDSLLKEGSQETGNNTSEDFEEEKFYTYKLPIAAVGGSLDGWGATDPIMPWQCERVVSPVKGVDLAVPVVGDSMAPDYPNGSTVYVKRINPASFINWGQVFVLDTENGSILKEVQPCKDDSCIECHSLNPNGKYKPFKVPKIDIRGMYRVVACVSLRG